jgi:hypothetical protein
VPFILCSPNLEKFTQNQNASWKSQILDIAKECETAQYRATPRNNAQHRATPRNTAQNRAKPPKFIKEIDLDAITTFQRGKFYQKGGFCAVSPFSVFALVPISIFAKILKIDISIIIFANF